MKIDTITKQNVLELMGSEASESEAVAMIALLRESGYSVTSEIPWDAWSRLIELAVGKAEIAHGVSAAAATLGRISTEKKATAARENGRKGGRPSDSAVWRAMRNAGWSVYMTDDRDGWLLAYETEEPSGPFASRAVAIAYALEHFAIAQ